MSDAWGSSRSVAVDACEVTDETDAGRRGVTVPDPIDPEVECRSLSIGCPCSSTEVLLRRNASPAATLP